MSAKETSLYDIASLLIQFLVPYLPRASRKKIEEPDCPGRLHAIRQLAAWLGRCVPDSVLTVTSSDPLDLVHYCLDQMKGYSSQDLARTLESGISDPTLRPRSQAALYLPHINVPSASIYHRVQSAVATKAFYQVDGTPYPTAEINTADARGQAQLRPLALAGC